MSIRAYRINEVVLHDNHSFNCWNDTLLEEFLTEFEDEEWGVSDQRNQDGCGILSVPLGAIRAAIEQADDLNIGELHIKRLKEDLAHAEEKGEESVDYMCF